MEQLVFRFSGAAPEPRARAACIAGVVASGNLEVLIETEAGSGVCRIDVNTAAHGFAATWEAVLRDFCERHRMRGVRIAINDAGATPATVALRLDQAFADFMRSGPTR
jgi:malonate decarboxylase delta subunit